MPQQAPWAWTLGGFGGSVAPPTITSPFARLDTTAAAAAQRGWAQVLPFGLKSAYGYSITFDLKVVSEEHRTRDRAGLSIIVLDSHHRGLELSFWTNEVWAQSSSPLFTHGEGAAYDTTAAGSGVGRLRHYNLRVNDTSYALYAEGKAILKGPTRDYSAAKGLLNPYSLVNFVWVGDDTKSASANVEFGFFAVEVADARNQHKRDR